MPVEAGLRATIRHLVGPDDLATALGSGTVEVLATPVVLTLCERASMAALDGRLEPGETTVGMRVQIDHVQPTAPGQPVEATAELDRIDGRRLTFTVEVTDLRGQVARGSVTRVVVDTERFLDRLA